METPKQHQYPHIRMAMDDDGDTTTCWNTADDVTADEHVSSQRNSNENNNTLPIQAKVTPPQSDVSRALLFHDVDQRQSGYDVIHDAEPTDSSEARVSASRHDEPHTDVRCQSPAVENSHGTTDVSNYDNVMVWLNQQACGGAVKRKRRISRSQRMAANVRERNRMVLLNTAFESLRGIVPRGPLDRRLSRIQTLRSAIDYIGFMTELLYGSDSDVTRSVWQQQHSDDEYVDIFTI